jgi:dipeptide/tripeptide permease
MNLNHVQKIILGLFTFLPFLLFPIFFWQFFHMIGSSILFDDHRPDEEYLFLSFVFPAILSAIGALALTIFYVVHAVLNKRLEGSEQILWIMLFIFLGILAFPAYWILRIWNTPKNA